jgi:4-diphosphocytidyl-2-C-methyl-D-erythritol kinase
MSVREFGTALGSSPAWPAPAKLNLCLYIVGRRADGYHLLQSAMQFINLQDELRFFRRPPGVIERLAGPAEIPADTDLIIRAARLLATRASADVGVGIAIAKRIPIQGGLGGGSSDAATALVALNRLWRVGLGEDELAELGMQLGADVPFFVRGKAAWAEGVGEKLTPVDFPEEHYLVVKPQVAVSTAEIFQAPELTRNSPVTTVRAFLAEEGRNDCTATVRGRYPQIAEALDWLEEFGDARLTGTGACVFLPVADETAARTLSALLDARWRGYSVRGLNRSPLLRRLEVEPLAVRR